MPVAPSLAISKVRPTFSTLVDLLEFWASMRPDQVAYRFLRDGEDDEEALTYAELQLRARRISLALRDRARSGDRALLMYEPGLEFIIAFFGCLYAGVVAVPVSLPSKRQSYDRIQRILADADTRLIFTTESIRSQLLDDTLVRSDMQDVLLLTEAESLFHDPDDWTPPRLSESSIAFLQYTSGSTRTPKGVIVSHGNVIANERVIQSAFRHDTHTIVLGWLPHYHDMGLIGNILQPFYIGRPCVLMSPFHFVQKPFRWLRAISKYQATCSGGPNFAYEMCLHRITEDQRAALNLSSWQLAFTGAEVIRADTLRKFAEAFSPCGFNSRSFYPCYGLAEATLFVTGRLEPGFFSIRRLDRNQLRSHSVVDATPEDDGAVTLVGCGQTWPGHELRIVDPDSLQPCSPGQVGEIWVHGPCVSKGYWRRPEENRLSFAARVSSSGERPYLRTGDLGFLADGELFITGRLKDLIIIRGHNYYPHEIESTALSSSAGLVSHGGAAFSVDGRDEEKLVIIQEVARSHLRSLDYEQAIQRIRANVLRCHGLRLHAIVLVKPASVPRTSSGKIRRYLSRQMYQEDQFRGLWHWVDGKP